ncbi:MAG TPA: methylmalonyl-CoA mutase family protein [Chloroflexota bacterium]|nr:methylmalonyl-CoA mutase family protein [Chloroflexota bacterium]
MSAAEQPVETPSGIPLAAFYDQGAGTAKPPPGRYPFTRGIHTDMYRRRLWTMRQYSGFGTAQETNERFRFLLEQGQTGLSVAFDLPTQMGYDSDSPRATGEVGRVGVAIDSLLDMETLLEGIPLDAVSTSMTINATASSLLVLYQLAGERKGVAGHQLNGTVQNDILKEYAARGTYIYPPRPSMRLVTDLMAYARQEIPSWNTISISGYHMREAGSTAVQEIAFTLANAIAYVQSAIDAGLAVDDFAPRLSFFFNAHSDFLEEVAKFRAARQLWAEIMRDRFEAHNPRSLLLRFHTQTGGSTLTAQQPLNNVVRVALQALSAVLGGTQSLHTNGYDEALALPTEQAATLALRTQQIIADETGVPAVADPFGGAYVIEYLTDSMVRQARELIEQVEERGGAIAAIEAGYVQAEIEEAAYRQQRAIESGRRTVVGVNRYRQAEVERIEVLEPNPELERRQVEGLERLRAERDDGAVASALRRLADAARGDDNLLYPIKDAHAVYATIGEVSATLRSVFGTFLNPAPHTQSGVSL